MRFSGGFKTAGAGSTTLPMASLYSGASDKPVVVREVGLTNTTSTPFTVALRRATSVGGTHTARELLPEDNVGGVAVMDLFDTDTGTAPTITAGNLRVKHLGAQEGDGVIWTFGGNGLVIPAGTGNGIVIIGLTSPAICAVYFSAEE